MKVGIRAKLLAGFGARALCTTALAIYAYSAMATLSDTERTMGGDVFGGTYLHTQYIDASWASVADVQAVLLTSDAATRAALRKDIAARD
jgi:hypothetical protein